MASQEWTIPSPSQNSPPFYLCCPGCGRDAGARRSQHYTRSGVMRRSYFYEDCDRRWFIETETIEEGSTETRITGLIEG